VIAFPPSSFLFQISPAWVQHFIHHLAPQGMAGFVLANGSVSPNQRFKAEVVARTLVRSYGN